jgi:hypothetical protein
MAYDRTKIQTITISKSGKTRLRKGFSFPSPLEKLIQYLAKVKWALGKTPKAHFFLLGAGL